MLTSDGNPTCIHISIDINIIHFEVYIYTGGWRQETGWEPEHSEQARGHGRASSLWWRPYEAHQTTTQTSAEKHVFGISASKKETRKQVMVATPPIRSSSPGLAAAVAKQKSRTAMQGVV